MKKANEVQPATLAQIQEVLTEERQLTLGGVKELFAKERLHSDQKFIEERKYFTQLNQETIQVLSNKIDSVKTMLEEDHRAIVKDAANNTKRIVILERKVATF